MSRFPQITTAASAPAASDQRDLPAEVEAIRAWLTDHPAVTANALSVEAGLGRNSLTSLLREADPEKPTVNRLAKLYGALSKYGFHPQGQGLPLSLSAASVEQLEYLSAQGCALRLGHDGSWTVIRLMPVEIPAQGAGTKIITLAAGHALEHVLNQVVKLLRGESSS